eukprot:7436754-Pyramimonas_sp.AAC.1
MGLAVALGALEAHGAALCCRKREAAGTQHRCESIREFGSSGGLLEGLLEPSWAVSGASSA